MELLYDLSQNLIHKGLAASTRTVYRSKIKKWRLFLDTYDLDTSGITERNLVLYATMRYNTSKAKYATINSEITAIISSAVDTYDHYNRATMKTLQRVMSAIKRDPERAALVTNALTWNVLRVLLPHLPDSYNGMVVTCAIAFGHDTGMRVSEYLGSFDRKPTLTMDDLRFISSYASAQFLSIKLHHSKCNQFHKTEIVSISCNCIAGHCAFHLLMRMLSVRLDINKAQPVFQLSDGSTLSDRQLNKVISSLSVDVYGDASRFRAHSLRHGMATDLYRAGVPEHLICRFGRCAIVGSSSVQRYTHLNSVQIRRLVSTRIHEYFSGV